MLWTARRIVERGLASMFFMQLAPQLIAAAMLPLAIRTLLGNMLLGVIVDIGFSGLRDDIAWSESAMARLELIFIVFEVESDASSVVTRSVLCRFLIDDSMAYSRADLRMVGCLAARREHRH